MENCDKYKKRAIVGLILIFLLGLSTNIIDFNYYFSDIVIMLIIPFIGFFGLYLALPYIRCISDYNKISKPPF